MQKKRSKGVTIFGWIFIILGSLPLLMIADALVRYKYYDTLVTVHKSFAVLILAYIVGYGILLLILGIGLLKLKELARKAFLIFSCIILVISFIMFIMDIVAGNIGKIIGDIFRLAIFVSAFYFFTRPKVKEQFR